MTNMNAYSAFSTSSNVTEAICLILAAYRRAEGDCVYILAEDDGRESVRVARALLRQQRSSAPFAGLSVRTVRDESGSVTAFCCDELGVRYCWDASSTHFVANYGGSVVQARSAKLLAALRGKLTAVGAAG